MSDLPELKIRLHNPKTGAVRFKLPKKGGRWQGPVKSVDECIVRARKEGIPEPMALIYLEQED